MQISVNQNALFYIFTTYPHTLFTERSCAFSQVVTMVRLTLMYYIDFVAFMGNPDKIWNNILAKEGQKAPPEPSLFD